MFWAALGRRLLQYFEQPLPAEDKDSLNAFEQDLVKRQLILAVHTAGTKQRTLTGTDLVTAYYNK